MSMDTQKESKIVFDGDRKPLLDIYATTVLRKFEFNRNLGYAQSALFSGMADNAADLNVYIRFMGRVSDVKLELSSEPPLDKNRLVYILTMGKDVDTNFSPQEALKYMDMLANNVLKSGTNMINKNLPGFNINVAIHNSDALVPGGGQPTPGPGGVTRSANVNFSAELPVATNVVVSYQGSVNNINNPQGQVDIGHEVKVGWQPSSDSSLSLSGSIGQNPNEPGPVTTPGQVGLKLLYEVKQTFASWGAKATPVPKPTVTPTVVVTPAR
jgi:hypothetical protein